MLVYVLLHSFSMNIFMVLYPYYLSYKGLELNQIGGALAISMGASAFLLPFSGLLSDWLGRKPLIALTSIFLLLANLTVFLPTSIISASIGYFFFNSAFLIGNPVRNALIADSIDKGRLGEAFGIIATFFSIARVSSPYPGGYIAEHFGYNVLFSLNSIITFVAAIFALIAFKETVKEKTIPSKKLIVKELIKTIIPEKREKKFFSFIIIDRIAWSLWFNLITPYLREVYGFTPTQIGGLMTIVDATGVLTQYIFGKISDKIGAGIPMIFSEIAGIIVALSLAANVKSSFMPIVMVILGIAISGWIPAYNTYLSKLATNSQVRGRVFARANFYRSLIGSPFSAVGGHLFVYLSLSSPFILSATILAGIVVFFIRDKEFMSG